MAAFVTNSFSPYVLKALGALSATDGSAALNPRRHLQQTLCVVDDLLSCALLRCTLTDEGSRVVRKGLSVLCRAIKDHPQCVEESTELVTRVAAGVCEVMRFGDEAVTFFACQFLCRVALWAPQVLLSLSQMSRAVPALLASPAPSPITVAGVGLLLRLVSAGTDLSFTRCGAVVDSKGRLARNKRTWGSGAVLRNLVSPGLVHALCHLLRGCVVDWGAPGLNLGRRIMNTFSILLHKDHLQNQETIPNLSPLLVARDVPSLAMRMVRVALGLHCPITLLTSNDLLQHVCKAEPSVAKDLVCRVFDENIDLGNLCENESHDTAISILLWFNSFSLAMCGGTDLSVSRIENTIRRQRVYDHMKWILKNVDASGDLGWYLIATHVCTAGFAPLLVNAASTERLVSLQNDIRGNGLLGIAQKSLDEMLPLIRQRCGVLDSSEMDMAELEAALYVFCNVIFFYTLAVYNHSEAIAYSIVLGSLQTVLDTLKLYSERLYALQDPDPCSLGARALEEVLGLLNNIFYHRLETGTRGGFPVDQVFVQKGGAADMITQLARASLHPNLGPIQRSSLLRKQLESTLYLSQCLRSEWVGGCGQEDALARGGLGEVLLTLGGVVEEMSGSSEPNGVGVLEANLADIRCSHKLLMDRYVGEGQ